MFIWSQLCSLRSCCLKGSRARRALRAVHSQPDLYATLGISPSATPVEVKSAFIRRAKLLHPDVSASSSAASAADASAFIDVLAAYETLSDPSRRAKYDSERKLATFKRWAPDPFFSSSGLRRAKSGAPADERGLRPRFDEDPDRLFGGIGGIARRAYDGGSGSIWEALKRAHDGPAFLGGAGDFPYAFELDQRNGAESSDDVLRMTLGRQLLGVVRQQVSANRIASAMAGQSCPDSEEASGGCKLYPNSAAQAKAARATASLGAVSRSVAQSVPPLVFSFMGQDVARAVLLEPPRLAASPPAHTSTSDDDGLPASLRELLQGADGNPYRRCVIAIYQTLADADPPAPLGASSADRRRLPPVPEQEQPIAYILPSEGVRWAYLRRVVACHTAAAVHGRRLRSDEAPAAAAPEADAGAAASDNANSSNLLQGAAKNSESALAGAKSVAADADAGSGFSSSRKSLAFSVSFRQTTSRREANDTFGAFNAGAEEAPVAYGVSTNAAAKTLSHALGSSSCNSGQNAVVPVSSRHGDHDDVDDEFAALVARARARSRRPTRLDALRPPDEQELSAADLACDAAAQQHLLRRNGSYRSHYDHRDDRLNDGDAGEPPMAAPRQRRHGFGAAFRPEDAHASTAAAAAAHLAARPRWNQSREWMDYGGDGLGDIPHFVTNPMGPDVLAAAAAAAHGRAEKLHAAGTASASDAAAEAEASSTRESDSAEEAAPLHPLASAQHATHSLAVFKTPGAARMRLTRHGDGAVEASGSRTALPAAATWLWSPASEAHTRGSFYFELARRRLPPAAVTAAAADGEDYPWSARFSSSKDTQEDEPETEPEASVQQHKLPVGWCDGACHPSVIVMMGAIMTLEREWDEAAQAAAAGRRADDAGLGTSQR